MRAFIRAVLATLVLPLAAYQPPAAGPTQLNADKDAYEIYSLLLRQEPQADWHIKAWAIFERTGGYVGAGDCIRNGTADSALLDDYLAKNKTPTLLKRKFDLPQYALVGPEEIKHIGEAHVPYADEKAAEDPKFPLNALVYFTVSAVGFNVDHTGALVYVTHYCGSLCGGGAYHLMAKVDRKWRAERDWCRWNS